MLVVDRPMERLPRGHVEISSLSPGTVVRPHCGVCCSVAAVFCYWRLCSFSRFQLFDGRNRSGPTNHRLRLHLGLSIPRGDIGIRVKGEMRRWEEFRFGLHFIPLSISCARMLWSVTATNAHDNLVYFYPGHWFSTTRLSTRCGTERTPSAQCWSSTCGNLRWVKKRARLFGREWRQGNDDI